MPGIDLLQNCFRLPNSNKSCHTNPKSLQNFFKNDPKLLSNSFPDCWKNVVNWPPLTPTQRIKKAKKTLPKIFKVTYKLYRDLHTHKARSVIKKKLANVVAFTFFFSLFLVLQSRFRFTAPTFSLTLVLAEWSSWKDSGTWRPTLFYFCDKRICFCCQSTTAVGEIFIHLCPKWFQGC